MATTDEAIEILDDTPIVSGLDEVYEAVEALREFGVTGYALTVASSEMAKRQFEQDNPGRKSACYLYFAYFGFDGVASFLKVGISNNPRFRMAGIATGNPLDRLWVYAAKFPSRKLACRAERAIHARLRQSRRRGEWFHVDGMDEQGCRYNSLQLKREVIGDQSLFEVRG